MRELEATIGALEHLAKHCHGDERPECPILEGPRAPGALNLRRGRVS